jgi:hypothetical protein
LEEVEMCLRKKEVRKSARNGNWFGILCGDVDGSGGERKGRDRRGPESQTMAERKWLGQDGNGGDGKGREVPERQG